MKAKVLFLGALLGMSDISEGRHSKKIFIVPIAN